MLVAILIFLYNIWTNQVYSRWDCCSAMCTHSILTTRGPQKLSTVSPSLASTCYCTPAAIVKIDRSYKHTTPVTCGHFQLEDHRSGVSLLIWQIPESIR